jgi:hypothetical protein
MKTYGKEAAETIFAKYFGDKLKIGKLGVKLSKAFLKTEPPEELKWKFACDLEDPSAPDPQEAPNLPIPFTSNELAAFMLSGIGVHIDATYGSLEHGPDTRMLDDMGILAREPKEALTLAYSAYREAEEVVGKQLDTDFQVWRKAMVNQLLPFKTETGGQHTWGEHELRKLMIESKEPGMTHNKLAEKYKVSRQFISKMLKKATPPKSSAFTSFGRSNKK